MLDGLYAGSLADAEKRAETIPLARLEKLALEAVPPLDAMSALARGRQVKILAEVKRASPSRGDLSDIPDPAELANIYATTGASAISVLTEERKFKGSLADLDAVRARVDVPLLRKDFLANEYQIIEARAHGADIVLLIVAGLEQKKLSALKQLSEDLGMTAFIETHSYDEVQRALDLGGELIGVNARDLTTFETDRNLFGELAPLLGDSVIRVAESAVRSAADVAHYREAGADVVLVGEALVTSDPAAMLRSFLGA